MTITFKAHEAAKKQGKHIPGFVRSARIKMSPAHALARCVRRRWPRRSSKGSRWRPPTLRSNSVSPRLEATVALGKIHTLDANGDSTMSLQKLNSLGYNSVCIARAVSSGQEYVVYDPRRVLAIQYAPRT
jgi:hypothetical protein